MHWLRILQLCTVAIGIIWSGLTYAEDEDEARVKKGLVYVEPGSVGTSETQEEYKLVPYLQRRSKWGATFTLGYSSYEPIYYEPDFVPADFSQIYSSPDLPLIEFIFSVKRNLTIGSVGGEFGVGAYSNNSDDTELSDSTLTLIPLRAGLVFYMDALAPEPMVVPYVGGGVYTIMYKEELKGGSSNNGNTEVAMYLHGGVAISLDWIDREGARLAFQESGVESTSVYFELQKYMASSNVSDGDFSNDISYAGGVRVEF